MRNARHARRGVLLDPTKRFLPVSDTIRRVKEPGSVRSAAAEGAARAKRKLRILVADDERDQVATLAALLIDEGHEVREVYRGSEVTRMTREFDPDVALIDIGMPGMTGYDVLVADDAIIAGRTLMSAPPDLMVVDVALPYLDGVEFVAALKADTTMPQVPVIFMSGNADVLARARALGAPCLKKPFSGEQLLEAVRRELQLRPPQRRTRPDYFSAST